MIKELIVLATYGYYGGSPIQDMLAIWYDYGFFTYVLPFLLIFAIVFGILNRVNLFGKGDDGAKAIHAIIALAIGLMALQFHFVPIFFQEIFPRLGVGLSILLALVILISLFIDPEEKWINYVLLGVGAIILIIVLVQSSGAVNWYAADWWYNNWPMVAGAVLFLSVIGIIVGASNPPKTQKAGYSPFLRGLFGK